MFLGRFKCIVTVSVSLSLLGFLTGCGGGDSSSSSPTPSSQSAAETVQTFGDITTRVAGTAQQPVVSAAPGGTVIGVAGATISDISQSFVPSLAKSRIVFYSYRNRNAQIYSMNADGSDQTRLTNNTSGDVFPAYSPDGSKIAFATNRDGNSEIYSMNADGSNQTRLTNATGADAYASYSPDGTKIVFASGREGNLRIYTMNADGTSQTRLTNNVNTFDYFPSFSPDGTKIAFAGVLGLDTDVFVMNADGTNQTKITSGGNNVAPTFSPDGTKIVFSKSDGIYTMNADGSGQMKLANTGSSDFYPAYSPDGSKITFMSSRDGDFEIYTANADGSTPTRLTSNQTDEFSPAGNFGKNGSVWAYTRVSPKLVGAGGVFGSEKAGFLLGQKGTATASLVTFDTAAPSSRSGARVAAQTATDTNASNLVFTVTAPDSLAVLNFYNGFDIAPASTATLTNVPLPAGTTGTIVSFDAATGKVATVIPYAANRGAGALRFEQSGDTLTFTGSFGGVWDAKGENLTPDGAKSVRISAKTGRLIGWQ
ncbi:MAG: PD40 domain-containing protein [Akkermansiaceae bacterium]|nr:PD40 domain-containing protein [Armatimonadota bacterium]